MNGQSDYYQHDRAEVSALLPPIYSRVLEIGCGDGTFRQYLTGPHEYWGIEPATKAADVARCRLDKVLSGTYQDVASDLPDRYFDLIICNDVIEHMPDHDAFLQDIKDKMTPNGYLVASIPNVRFITNLRSLLAKKEWRYEDAGILDRTHLRFFTKKSLQRTIQQNGYAVDQFEELNCYSPRNILISIIHLFEVLLLGRDVRVMQFGVRLHDASR